MITLKHVNKWYNKNKQNEIHVINDVSLELPEKGMIAIFGKSGCGKTTMLNAIGGLDSIGSGEISINGKSITKDTDYLRNRHIGYIFQNYCLSKDQTVYDNVADALRLCGMTDESEIERRVITALDSVGMKKYLKRTPDALSGGQQQRVAIARAIVKSPSIILADEPTGNIDEKNTIAIMDMLKAISKDSLVLLVTHEAKLVDFYCDRVIELQDGQIKNVYENEHTGGYVKKDKNTIYLGELECSKDSFEGIDLEYYGEKTPGLKLRVIRSNGKLYIQSSDPSMKMIDGTGEIKLREGVYDEKVENEHREISMPALPAFEGSNYGKLFSFKSSLVGALKEQFTAKSKKVRTRLLKVCMFALAIVLVISSANFAVFINDYYETVSNYNKSVVYVPVISGLDTSDFKDKAAENGIDFASFTRDIFAKSSMSFYALDFMTASSVRLSASGDIVSTELIKNCKLVAGTDTLTEPNDMIITTAVADELIKTSPVSTVSRYEDLIGLLSSTYDLGAKKVVGIVESGEKYFVLSDIYCAYETLRNFYIYTNVMPRSLADIGYDLPEIPKGSAAVFHTFAETPAGNTVKIAGHEYNVVTSEAIYTSIDEYWMFAEKDKGLLPYYKYYDKLIEENPDITDYEAICRWTYDYYYAALPEFVSLIKDRSYLEYMAWLLAEHYSPDYLFAALYWKAIYSEYSGSMAETYYAGYVYNRDMGVYPEKPEQALEYLYSLYPTDDHYEGYIADMISMQADQYSNEYWSNYYNYDKRFFNKLYIISDEDYISLAYTLGENDMGIVGSQDYLFPYDDDYPYTYILMHTTDLEKTLSFLGNYVDQSRIVTPDNYLDFLLRDSIGEIIGNLISFLVMLALLSVCVYFIMRSVMMNRIKEIGIYRAIGVSKKNVLFKFFIDAGVLTTFTVFIGYAITAAFMINLDNNPVIGHMIYFPLWLAVALYVFIFAVCTFFGTLPVITLLKKTPSGILAKYDI